MNTQRILLCGFMGCGKTSVGQALSFRLRWDFLDTDEMIEKHEGRTIPQIFAEDGEEAFRAMETETARQLERRREVVISTGGGFLLREENRRIIRETPGTQVVLLDCDFETCYQRIKNSSRPLVASNTKEQLEELYRKRAAIYRQAATVVLRNRGIISEAVDEILRQVVIL